MKPDSLFLPPISVAQEVTCTIFIILHITIDVQRSGEVVILDPP